jgi:hypothetical protein
MEPVVFNWALTVQTRISLPLAGLPVPDLFQRLTHDNI